MKSIRTVVCATLFSSLFVCQAVYGQFIPYSQYHNAPLLTNPAAPSLTDYMQVTLHYRRSRVANYDIPSISFMMPFYRQSDGLRYGGIGANIINQKAGPNGLYKVTGATGTFAYTLHLSKNHHIGAGISGGIVNKRLDASAITTESQYNLGVYDPSLGNGENIRSSSVTRPVINAGFGWVLTDADDRQKATLGVAAYNMNQPAFDLIDNAASDDMTYVVSGEVDVFTRNRVTLSPTFRYIHQGTSAANIGARVRYALNAADDELSAGLWYKTTKALVAGAQYNYKAYVIGASIDLSTGGSRDANINNAVEIVLGWRMNRKDRMKPRTTTAPAKTPAPVHEEDTVKTEETVAPAQEEKEEDTKPADTSVQPGQQADSTSTVPPQTSEPVPPTPEPQTETAAPILPPTPATIPFEPGSNNVSAKDQRSLEELAAFLKAHPEYRLKISGHSARLGDRPTKDRVSYERAQAVAKILTDQGVPAQQLEVVGMGDRKPIASNKTKAGRHKNRRVEFEWIKK
jgi:type IX secretion system PorP/SprF family membrane protein